MWELGWNDMNPEEQRVQQTAAARNDFAWLLETFAGICRDLQDSYEIELSYLRKDGIPLLFRPSSSLLLAQGLMVLDLDFFLEAFGS